MENEFLNYQQSLALKELGFDEPCFCYWYTQQGYFPSIRGKDIAFNGWKNYSDSNTVAPLKQQVFRWFRKNYKMAIINPDWNNKFNYKIFNLHLLNQGVLVEKSGFCTYEEAESACIDKLIEIVKEKRQ